jgi:hypothetical protein
MDLESSFLEAPAHARDALRVCSRELAEAADAESQIVERIASELLARCSVADLRTAPTNRSCRRSANSPRLRYAVQRPGPSVHPRTRAATQCPGSLLARPPECGRRSSRLPPPGSASSTKRRPP